ncbi:RagB/SusD family nutrient uptake outer membrane protein [Parachryseolinea silvisoli]|uniref:RagB/SusD family nutrient uptake outer membrane protein n=1 Tax=Parachryseolinea silvisoli TaxID=2873601 RepID=UPI002265827B|nr:RagB/SusD family nutrient uptake outer membrane protein [Parachryseolinea silvisoli]MCD9019087.1 RagB/SusD family nutrient uptake outer membrane protein [Parachryseolinea silvisoli]
MKKYSILFVVFLLATQACNDDFLERSPQTEISEKDFFHTADDLDTYLYSVYNFGGVGIYVEDVSTDNTATTGVTELKNMMAGSPTAANVTEGWTWDQLRKINYYLDHFGTATLTEAQRSHYEGLGRFFRAKFYMGKVARYSDVPWYEKTLTQDDPDLYKGRDTRTTVVDKIFEDLEFARQYVDADASEDRPGAVTKWVVRAFMADAALFEGTFRKYHTELNLQSTADKYLTLASEVADEVITDGGFALYNTGKPESDYASLFTSGSLEGNTEVILGRFYEAGLLNSGWWGYMFGNYEVSPSKDLLQTYLMADGTPYTSQAGYATNQFVEEFADRDPRLKQTFAYPGWELINNSTYAQGAGIYIQELSRNFTGYHQIKGFVNNTDTDVQNNLDIPLIRLAEIYLIFAEAKAELGTLTQGDLDGTVNLLRARVGMPALAINPSVDPVLQAQYPLVAGGQAAVLLEIRRERRVELALEGYRFDDLMRWHAGERAEIEPEGVYFPGLGKYDLTGDNIDDIILLPADAEIPGEANKEKNSLGKTLVYYRVGAIGTEGATFYLKDGEHGNIATASDLGTFEEPKFYYRPVPQPQVLLNPNLTQIMGW